MDRKGDDKGADAGESGLRGPIPFWGIVLMEAALAPFALALGWLFRQPPLADFIWDEDAILWGLAAVVPMIALMALATRFPLGPLQRIKSLIDRDFLPVFHRCEWPDLALLSFAAGLGEEMLFRGVIQRALSRAFGPAIGITIASVLFGLLHPVSPVYVVLTGLLGAYLGVVWYLSGNLLTVIVAHSVYDFVTFLVLLESRKMSEDSKA